MKPRATDEVTFAVFDTDAGPAAMAVRHDRLVGLWLPGPDTDDLVRLVRRRLPGAVRHDDTRRDWQDKVAAYFKGETTQVDIPVDLSDQTPFRRAVLHELMTVPRGHTVTYGELARRVGRPGGARAVGGVMAANPVPLVVPCHRVVSSDGSPGGFSAGGGIDLKRRMLALEGLVCQPPDD